MDVSAIRTMWLIKAWSDMWCFSRRFTGSKETCIHVLLAVIDSLFKGNLQLFCCHEMPVWLALVRGLFIDVIDHSHKVVHLLVAQVDLVVVQELEHGIPADLIWIAFHKTFDKQINIVVVDLVFILFPLLDPLHLEQVLWNIVRCKDIVTASLWLFWLHALADTFQELFNHAPLILETHTSEASDNPIYAEQGCARYISTILLEPQKGQLLVISTVWQEFKLR